MEVTAVDLWMQRAYWLSQILLPMIAILGGFIAYRQWQTFRLYEMLKHIERSDLREARAIVLREIARTENKGRRWWRDDRLHDAAALVSSSYDHIGLIISFHKNGRVEQIFLERWGEGIVRTHEVLDDFLKWRRETGPKSYAEYTTLYQQAKKLYPNVLPPKIEGEGEPS